MSASPVEHMALDSGYSMQSIFANIPTFMDILARNSPVSYDKFVKQIDKDLNNIISITESGRQHHFEKGEDAITEHLIVQLKQLYPSVHHDAQNGGHCDIYIEVKSTNGNLYKWVMEAKLWEGFEYVYKGLDDQLLGSYAVGGVDNCKGGMIFYSKLVKGASFAMTEWHDGLQGKGISISNLREDKLRFDTAHKLNSGTGADFYVNHYCVDLYHEPSAQKAANAKCKKENKAPVKPKSRSTLKRAPKAK
ncbi:hypothetical protein AOY64_08650 [Escherichia coli]|uniref:hypothetical protein n=1 Tax=Escherichia coli TaxID=562 RepID=UPI000B428133|nr:hypothetical protein [Escherichia coli]EEW1818861.1 hypothetical protein [Escherichia coli]EFH9475158.1 hypothetical protein [Escherichia coli]EFJ7571001.1 hypothetical protein [Escherichia coli]EFL9778138.1 hypothetical protein [Escherichia coli]EHC4277962.1 hypothetical protein [Escherichia coli]